VKLKLRFCQKCKHQTLQVQVKGTVMCSHGDPGWEQPLWYCPNCGTNWETRKDEIDTVWRES